MGTTLDNGIYLPDEGERNCYEGLAGNWVALDNHLGSTNIHVTINDKQAWDGHVADTTIHVTSADKQTWNSHVADTTIHVTSADKQTWNSHVADTTIHVTSADKQAWDGHVADTTIHVTSADKQAWNGHVADSVKHVTAEDKAKWDAVTSKADDSDVVHKSGDETVGGVKTFTDNNMIKTSSPKVVLTNTSQTGNTAPSSNTASFLRFDGGTVANFGGVQCEFLTTGENRLTNYVKDITTAKLNSIQQRANSTTAMTVFNADLLAPATDGVTALGSRSKRWSDVQTNKINTLEPSSLSLPSDRSARIDISSYFTNTGTGQSNSYTVPANGYIYLTLSELTNVHCFSRTSGNVTNYAQTFTKLNNSTGALYVLFPVRKNDVFVTTWYTTTTVSVDGAFFIPCQGNI